MTADFAKTMSRLPDEELYRIAYPGADEDFDPAATAAAGREIESRGVSDADAQEIQARLHLKREQGRAGSFREHLEFSRPDTAIERVGRGVLLLILIVSLANWFAGWKLFGGYDKVVPAMAVAVTVLWMPFLPQVRRFRD